MKGKLGLIGVTTIVIIGIGVLGFAVAAFFNLR